MIRVLWCCYRKLDKDLTAGVFYVRRNSGCHLLICSGEKICVGVLVVERYYQIGKLCAFLSVVKQVISLYGLL